MNFLKPTLSRLNRTLSALYLTLSLASLVLFTAGYATAQGYNVKPGDILRIEVLEDPSLNRTVLVAPDGRISVPSAGTVSAKGQTIESIQQTLTERLTKNFATTPNVFVAIEQLAAPQQSFGSSQASARTISVYVLGEANTPGKLDIEQGTTTLQIFAVMGGFTRFAATKRIQLRRTDPASKEETVYRLNYPAITAGTNGGNAILLDGDVIVVPQRRLFE